MDDKAIFDPEYDQPSATGAGTRAEGETEQESADAALQEDPRDPVKVYDTGRPYLKKTEWPISNG